MFVSVVRLSDTELRRHVATHKIEADPEQLSRSGGTAEFVLPALPAGQYALEFFVNQDALDVYGDDVLLCSHTRTLHVGVSNLSA